jgi:hypothetical protein
MNKQEKQLAALYLASCLNESRIAQENGHFDASKKAMDDFVKYRKKLRDMLSLKFEMFGLEYSKSVEKPIQDVMKLAGDYYSNLVNGQPAF